MAVWQMVGGSVTMTDASLMEQIILTGVQPADFDPAAVSEIVIEWTLNITGTLDDDDWTDRQKAQLNAGGTGQTIGTADAGADVTRTAPGSWPKTGTILTPTVQLTPTGNTLRAPTGTWATFNKTKSPDGSTATIVGATVRVTYEPAAAVAPVASYTAALYSSGETVVSGQKIDTGETVIYTDTSTGDPTEWLWEFGEGAVPATANTKGPHAVTYPAPGVYTVEMGVANEVGQDTAPPDTITVEDIVPTAKIETFIEDFATFSPLVWTGTFGAVALEDGRLAVSETVAAGSVYSGTMTASVFDLVDSSVFWQMVPPPPAMSRETTFGIYNGGAALNGVWAIILDNPSLVLCRIRTNGVNSDFTYPYDPVAHAWFRVRMEGTIVYWDTSPDCVNWTNQRFFSWSYSGRDVQIECVHGHWQGVVATGTAYFDNINVLPVGPPVTGGRPSVFTGTVWEPKPGKVWDGSSWVEKPWKKHNGTAWVEL